MSDYHGRIMNLQIDKKQGAFDDRTPKEILAYKAGHRDARHAAAELAIEADQQIEAAEALAAALQSIKRHTDPKGEDGTYRYDSANDACDFAFSRASEALAAWEAEEIGK